MKEDKQLTNNFKLSEFEKSETATKKKIDNTIPTEYLDNVQRLAEMLQVIRDNWGEAIKINSGYRCKELNTAIGGAKNSSHLYASSADITAKNKTKNVDLWNLIRRLIDKGDITTHQLIWEKGTKKCPQWIHISVNCENRPYKENQILYLY